MTFFSEYKHYSSFNQLMVYKGERRKNFNAKVSVIIPAYNSSDSIKLVLSALEKQTISSLDVIVVNDGGTYVIPRSNFSLLQNYINQGAYGSRNYGLRNAIGDFITVHDADDWSHPQKLEMQVKALLDNPKAVASVSHWARCTEDMQFETRPDGSIVHRNVSSLMIRREVFERLGYWDRVSVNADTEYYYRILAAYGPESIIEVMPGEPLALGRRHAGSLTMQPETHWKTQFGGVRKEYMDAAYAWHKKCAESGDWYMPYAPEERPFPVPATIDRPVIELNDRVWPHIRGEQSIQLKSEQGTDHHQEGHKCVLLCGHAAGGQCFGAERSLLDLAEAISSLGYRLIITLPERNGTYFEQLKPYCSDIVLLPAPWRKGEEVWDVAVTAFESLMKRFNVDLVHVNTVVHRAPLEAAQKQGVARILHVRELLSWDNSLLKAMGEMQGHASELFHCADRLLANSDYTAKALCSGFEEGSLATRKIKVLCNTVTLESSYQPKRFLKGETIRVGMVSSNLPKKGLADFKTIADKALERKLPLHFYLVGPRNTHTESLEKNKPVNVTFVDYCLSPDTALIHLDVLLNLSEFQESFGRTVAEAMLAAKPVIAYRWGALPELVKNGVNGLLAHIGDTDGVLKRLEFLCQLPDSIYAMGEQGQRMASSRFSQSRFQTELSSVYDELI